MALSASPDLQECAYKQRNLIESGGAPRGRVPGARYGTKRPPARTHRLLPLRSVANRSLDVTGRATEKAARAASREADRVFDITKGFLCASRSCASDRDGCVYCYKSPLATWSPKDAPGLSIGATIDTRPRFFHFSNIITIKRVAAFVDGQHFQLVQFDCSETCPLKQ